jgi:hypothetical protein
MEYQAVVNQMLYGEERRRKANLLRFRLVSIYFTAQGFADSPPPLGSTFVRFDIEGVDALLADAMGFVVQPLEIQNINECCSAARIANRMLDYATLHTVVDYGRKINSDLTSEISSLAFSIGIGAETAERRLARALDEESYL